MHQNIDPILIGLVGPAGSGKSTAADHLEDAHGFIQAAFADTLKDMLAALFLNCDVDYAHLHEPQLKPRPVPELHDLSARELMTSLGDWGRARHERFWIDQLAYRVGLHATSSAPVHDRIVVSDVRYPNEAEWITRLGGRLVRITRLADGVAPVGEVPSAPASALHGSERGHLLIDAWWQIDNRYSHPSLHYQLAAMLHAGWPSLFQAPRA